MDARLGQLDRDDLDVLGYDTFVAQLEAGIAAHHAGMVPPFKEVVERCFVEGLVKVVFATETLAVGINMPARTVVIEKLTKFTGEHHEFLTPGDYTQLTGRAGRRGLDDAGQALVLWSPFVRFEQVATLAASRMFHLRSVFRPTYNMVSNLVASYRPDEATHLLSLSFAQYQADRDVVRIEARLDRKRSELRHSIARAESPYGDVWAYRTRSDRKAGADGVEEALAAPSPGRRDLDQPGQVRGSCGRRCDGTSGEGPEGLGGDGTGGAVAPHRRQLHGSADGRRRRSPCPTGTPRSGPSTGATSPAASPTST